MQLRHQLASTIKSFNGHFGGYYPPLINDYSKLDLRVLFASILHSIPVPSCKRRQHGEDNQPCKIDPHIRHHKALELHLSRYPADTKLDFCPGTSSTVDKASSTQNCRYRCWSDRSILGSALCWPWIRRADF